MTTVMYGAAPWPNNPRPLHPFEREPFGPGAEPSTPISPEQMEKMREALRGLPPSTLVTRDEFAKAIESLRAAVRDLEAETIARLDAIGVHGVGVILAQKLVEANDREIKRLKAKCNRLRGRTIVGWRVMGLVHGDTWTYSYGPGCSGCGRDKTKAHIFKTREAAEADAAFWRDRQNVQATRVMRVTAIGAS